MWRKPQAVINAFYISLATKSLEFGLNSTKYIVSNGMYFVDQFKFLFDEESIYLHLKYEDTLCPFHKKKGKINPAFIL